MTMLAARVRPASFRHCECTHQRLGSLAFHKRRLSSFVVAIFACCATLGNSHLRAEPRKALQDFVDEKLAKSYMDSWKKKDWQTTSKCTNNLPAATASMIHTTCGARPEPMDRCVCIVAKAHSCHVGCTKKVNVKPACPAACSSKTCKWGAASNGGVALSDGGEGTCYKYCSKVIGPVRYCGVGGVYQAGGHVDCTGCDPSRQSRLSSLSPAQAKKHRWMECMADCYPTPSCTDMCAEGSSDCFEQCVERYKSSVEPFWHVFKRSDTTVPDYKPA